ncbi:MAG TPA: site-2 protease family protein, partial [Nocardioidaceae bacterium]|nr:site-2 protease family protein [Nocardioidaceae bacterium]
MPDHEPDKAGADEPLRRPRAPGTIRIGQIAGVDVLITTSWFLIAGLIAVVMAPRVEEAEPGLGLGTYVA